METNRKHRKISGIIRKNKKIDKTWKWKNLKAFVRIWRNLSESERHCEIGKNLRDSESIWGNMGKPVGICKNFEESRKIWKYLEKPAGIWKYLHGFKSTWIGSKNLKECKRIQKNPKGRILKKKRIWKHLKESEGVQENLREHETKNRKDLERIRENLRFFKFFGTFSDSFELFRFFQRHHQKSSTSFKIF